MAQIADGIRDKLAKTGVRIFFVSGAVTKWYNARRADPRDEPCLFGGWFWTWRAEENGPFRTPSAAKRDFYYRTLLNVVPPGLSEEEVQGAQDEIQLMIAQAQAEAKAEAERAKRRAGKRTRLAAE